MLFNTQIQNYYKVSEYSQELLKHVPQLNQRYIPSPQLPFRFMRMIYGTLDQEKTISYWREIIIDHIGESVALDWVDKDFEDDNKIAVILPGLTGHSE